uniref:Uncharacterized protein n=1 Tax=uncultured alpha proteobacterium HF0010_13E22 TaxID=710801 RepID=E0XQY4_9PROT|nr:hypothetical protein [uncultured alpha proteobacterium HF0010_13E22]
MFGDRCAKRLQTREIDFIIMPRQILGLGSHVAKHNPQNCRHFCC